MTPLITTHEPPSARCRDQGAALGDGDGRRSKGSKAGMKVGGA